MPDFLWILFGLLFVVFALELGCRVWYRLNYGFLFQGKVIGEYPYADFMEKSPEPIYFQHKQGFRSPEVNMNRFGLRGPEPAPDSQKKRIMIMGESEFFGAKLPREKDLWSINLQEILNAKGLDRWEVINAGVAGYNGVQFHAMWQKKWREINPDILLIRIGANEISQSYAMGSKWHPGLSWPYEFILKMQKRSSWYQRYLRRSCLYCTLKRKNLTKRAKFQRADEGFQWDSTIKSIFRNQKAIAEDAMAKGIRVAFVSMIPAYRPNMTQSECLAMESIQSNWQEFYDGWARFQFEYIERLQNDCAPRTGIPFLNLAEKIWREPQRAKYYLDIVHFNAKGHTLLAKMLFEGVDRLGWWERE
jgi:lysophospholipase L1-like esterase